jgi:hypothetical protein
MNINIKSRTLTQSVAVRLIENAAKVVVCCKWYVYMVNLGKLYARILCTIDQGKFNKALSVPTIVCHAIKQGLCG